MSTALTYAVTGLTCEHCVRAVTDELTALPGVRDVGRRPGRRRHLDRAGGQRRAVGRLRRPRRASTRPATPWSVRREAGHVGPCRQRASRPRDQRLRLDPAPDRHQPPGGPRRALPLHHRTAGRRGRDVVPTGPHQGPAPDRGAARPVDLPARAPHPRGRRDLDGAAGPRRRGLPGAGRLPAGRRRPPAGPRRRPAGARRAASRWTCPRRAPPSRLSTATRSPCTAHPVAGHESDLVLSVREGGRPVTTLQPYLGAYGHLVALRAGDLAYLHAHPPGAADDDTGGGPDLAFVTSFPTAGTYRLFLDFRAGGVVRTAAFTIEVRVAEVELAIGGMTCASCAARVEKKLNRMDGVVATVNYATEKARVTFADGVTPDDLVATVARTGYTAELPQQDPAPTDDTTTPPTTRPRRRLAAPADARHRRPHRSGAGPVDGAGVPARRLEVARADPGHPGRHLGRLAVPPRRPHRAAARRVDDGHPGLGRHHGGLRLVAVRAVPRRRRRRDLPRGRYRRHAVPAHRPLPRGPGPARVRCRDARTAVAGREGRGRPARRRGGAGAGHRAAGG